ncbi:cobalamin B12-binding domain-containing protein [Sphingomonas humi]|uniref:B12-binding domain-containing protein n=1 Tax=Sphingomonas humi TaxID=335630 RepID=A0ABP7S3S7_9SPHN
MDSQRRPLPSFGSGSTSGSSNDLTLRFTAPEYRGLLDDADRRQRIARLVASEIAPRLEALHAVIPLLGHPTANDVSELARLVIASDGPQAADYVASLRDGGLSVDTLFAELLEPAAQRLGELWEADEVDFIDVTLGVARLQALLSVFNCTHEIAASGIERSVLMMTVPGEQHSFGIAMVERLLTAGGWLVSSEREATPERLARIVGQQWFGVVGLTLSNRFNLEAAARSIDAIRRYSRNRAIGIMVGGPVFSTNRHLATEIGADGTASSASGAVVLAQKLLDHALAASVSERPPSRQSAG